MSTVSTLARVIALPGKGDALVSFFPGLLESAQSEPGTIVYVLNRVSDKPDEFWFHETYESEDARNAHRASPYVIKIWPQMQELISSVELIYGSALVVKH